MPEPGLGVFFGQQQVGRLARDADDRFTFAYDAAWLSGEEAFPVSVSLPLTDEVHVGGPAYTFFANLLPEGTVRQLVFSRLGISADNDFELLRAIGGECAGALSLVEGGAPDVRHDYRPLPESELLELVASGSPVLALLSGTDGVRLSLAGAQDKLPVRMHGERMLLPLGSAPSTHLLKFPSPSFRHLPANEVFCTMLARDLGLPVPEVTLLRVGELELCLVQRYDRVTGADGELDRLHQEDLCQALGLPPGRKYQKEGGPDFARCFQAVSEHSTEPLADSRTLLRWLVFNLLAGNADGHAKNLSLLRPGPRELTLSPCYDLVCTRAYRLLDRHLALAVGRQSDPGQVGRADWQELARSVGVSARYMLDTALQMAEEMADAAQRTASQFCERHGASPVLEMILPLISKQTRRCLTLLS